MNRNTYPRTPHPRRPASIRGSTRNPGYTLEDFQGLEKFMNLDTSKQRRFRKTASRKPKKAKKSIKRSYRMKHSVHKGGKMQICKSKKVCSGKKPAKKCRTKTTCSYMMKRSIKHSKSVRKTVKRKAKKSVKKSYRMRYSVHKR